jgi:hypothetical protein
MHPNGRAVRHEPIASIGGRGRGHGLAKVAQHRFEIGQTPGAVRSRFILLDQKKAGCFGPGVAALTRLEHKACVA